MKKNLALLGLDNIKKTIELNYPSFLDKLNISTEIAPGINIYINTFNNYSPAIIGTSPDAIIYQKLPFGPWDIGWKPLPLNRKDFMIAEKNASLLAYDKILVETEWQKYTLTNYMVKLGFSKDTLEENILVMGLDRFTSLPINGDNTSVENNYNVLVGGGRIDLDFIDKLTSYLNKIHPENPFTFFIPTTERNSVEDIVTGDYLDKKHNVIFFDQGTDNVMDYYLTTEITDRPQPALTVSIVNQNLHPIVPYYGSYVELLKGEYSRDRFFYNLGSIDDCANLLIKLEKQPKSSARYCINEFLNFNSNIIKLIGEIANE